jgi:hypothetical protein
MPVDVTEQEILEALLNVPVEKWRLVLEILHNLELREAQPSDESQPIHWTATQLRALPIVEQEAILEAQSALAATDYPIGLDDD